MIKKQTQKITLCAIAAALTFLVTAFIPVKIPLFTQGYFNLGDSILITASLFVGGIYGGLAGGIGAALADIVLGFGVYAPATFIIKFLMGIAAFYTFKLTNKLASHLRVLAILSSALVAELIMVSGYFLFEVAIYGLATSIADILGNASQGFFNLIATTFIYEIINRTKIFNKLIK